MSSSSIPPVDEKKKKKKKSQTTEPISERKDSLTMSSPPPSKTSPPKSRKESTSLVKSTKSAEKIKKKSAESTEPKSPTKQKQKSVSPDKHKQVSRDESDERKKMMKLSSSSPEIPEVQSPRRTLSTDDAPKKSPEKKPGMSKLDQQLSKAPSATRTLPAIIHSINSPKPSSPAKKKKIKRVEGHNEEPVKSDIPAKKKRGRPAKPYV